VARNWRENKKTVVALGDICLEIKKSNKKSKKAKKQKSKKSEKTRIFTIIYSRDI
jgi:hypothetical protein